MMPSATISPPTSGSLKDELAAVLPQGFQCKVRYVHTPSKRCDPLFSSATGQTPDITRLASHFLTVSVDCDPHAVNDAPNGVLVYGVEALVYTTKKLTTIFVSKADSTGYLPQQKPSPVKLITTTFLKWLSNSERQRHPTRKLVISLFARSQSQYLFPGSAENSKKHVLDDRQLIKWWARVLHPVVTSLGPGSIEGDGYVTVPGLDRSEVRPYLPPPSASDNRVCWHVGDPLAELAEARGIVDDASPRCVLPRFPDDPKARFMQDLDDEAGIADDASVGSSPSKRKGGKWTSVRGLSTFWDLMAYRQECSSGRLVGFIWLLIRPERRAQKQQQDDGKEDAQNPASQESLLSVLSSDSMTEDRSSFPINSSPRKQRRRLLTGPIVPRQPRLKGGSSSLTASDLTGMLNIDAGNGALLEQAGYDKVMHALLHLDFANAEVAAQSTSKWVAEVSQTSGWQTDWALDITGAAKLETMIEPGRDDGSAQVNDLGGMIRKKRKADDGVSAGNGGGGEVQVGRAGQEKVAVNVLGSGMVRKKPKATPAAS